ncbi:hypothetical protein ACFXGI_25980 [Streptomyces sp. NPDC059355]|uniref:hypothetical protein n=1 Tax=Streptomyces sp. NPDC059355 TaxID=3346811 RepID=UPI00369AC524
MNRILLAAYPEDYRTRQGEEVLGCLAEAYPGRSWPPPREVFALLRGGVQARARAAVEDTSRPWWLDGFHLTALVLAALALVPYLQDVWHWALQLEPGGHTVGFEDTGWFPWTRGPGTRTRFLPYGLLPLICLVALVRGKRWIALPASAAMLLAGSGIAGSTFFGDEGVVGVGYYGLGAPLRADELVLSGTLFLTCAGLAAYRPSPLRRRSYGWLVPVAGALVMAGALHITSGDPNFQRGLFALEVAALITAWMVTAATGDHRWLIPVAAFTLVRVEAIAGRPSYLVGSLPSHVVLICLLMPIPLLAITAQRRRSRTT